MTPIPGKSFRVIFPFTTSTPLNRSLEISKLPSRSAKSTNGENCEAAEIAHEVSVIQPTITRIPSCLLYTSSLCERERMYKRKTKAVFFANRTVKIRTLFIILQNFSEVFLFFSLSAISLFHYVNSARLSSLGKRVQKYTLLVYNPNILNSFF